MPGHRHPLSSLRTRVLLLQTRHLLRRANRHRREQLSAELSAYRTPADLADLHAILDEYPDGQTHEIREILATQSLTRLR